MSLACPIDLTGQLPAAIGELRLDLRHISHGPMSAPAEFPGGLKPEHRGPITCAFTTPVVARLQSTEHCSWRFDFDLSGACSARSWVGSGPHGIDEPWLNWLR
jgi:hypothetical protein